MFLKIYDKLNISISESIFVFFVSSYFSRLYIMRAQKYNYMGYNESSLNEYLIIFSSLFVFYLFFILAYSFIKRLFNLVIKNYKKK